MKKTLLTIFLCLAHFYCASTGSSYWGKMTAGKLQTKIEAGFDVNQKDEKGVTPLMYAAGYSSDTELISELIKAGADPNATDNAGWTVLRYAAKFNQNPEIIQALVKGGANVKLKYHKNQYTALISAANNPEPKVLKALIDAGANVNQGNKFGFTTLINAAKHNPNTKVLVLLIDSGAKINAIDSRNNQNALMYAITHNKSKTAMETIKILLDNGIDLKAKNKDGLTAIELAHQKGRHKIAKFLEEKQAQ